MELKVGLISLGCAKNLVDSEVMLGILKQKYQLTNNPQEANILIVNTCGFIDKAKEESINTIVDLIGYKESGNCKALVVSGCMAQKYSQELAEEIPEIDAIIGTDKVAEIDSVVEQALQGQKVLRISTPEYIYDDKTPRVISTPSYSAYVKLADGCDNCCAYCVIPELRGRFRSRPMESVVAEVKQLVASGVKEVMLIAQDTTRYGLDIYGEFRLPALLRELEHIEGLAWIRLLYCYPTHFSDELIEVIQKSQKICRYVDLPIQHANNRILKAMNRQGTKADILELVKKIRAKIPDMVIRTSFIVGLPGESAQDFEELLEFMQEIKFDRVGIFTYSQEEGTPAAEMDNQVAEETKVARQNQAMALQNQISYEKNLQRVGKIVRVLVEGVDPEKPDLYYGRSEFDAPEVDGKVYFTSLTKCQPGTFVEVRVSQAYEYDLMGEVNSELSK